MRNGLLLLLLASGCTWENLPNGEYNSLSQPAWSPEEAQSLVDGLYIPLPAAGDLVRVLPDGTFSTIDLAEGTVAHLSPSPSLERMGVFLDTWFCDPEDPRDRRDIESLDDCPSDERERERTLRIVTAGTAGDVIPINTHLNAIAWSPSERFAIGYLDADRGVEVNGVINLVNVQVVDLETGESTAVGVGFAPDRVLYTEDGSRAVVLSQNRVAVIDLAAQPPVTEVVFPLTLDPDQSVTPDAVTLTPDGRYAMISVRGSADLYVLDLDAHSVNLVSLPAAPADLFVDAERDRTVIVYENRPVVDLLDHAFFDLETTQLDESMNRITRLDGQVLLYNDERGHDVYRLDLETGDVVEYRLQNPAIEVQVAPGGEWAVALTRAEGNGGSGLEGTYDASPGMEVLDLRSDKGKTSPWLLEGQGLGLAFAEGDNGPQALVLQADTEYLYQLDVLTGAATELELDTAPAAIGALPEGPWWIMHPTALGLVSFVDPQTFEVTEVSGFALSNLATATPVTLVEE